jgi:cyclophilin family peptidyl-prolyl cis-trans isomerase
MKTFIALASLITLVACTDSKFNPRTDGGGGGGDLATASDGGNNNLYAPAGYTVTPFLSQSSTTHTFSMAQQVVDPNKDYAAVIITDVGRIVLQLYAQQTPITVNSLVFLALNHFYDGIAFHRVIDNFMAQTGDPNSIDGDPSTWGTGGCGYNFGLEIDSSLHYDSAGVLGMARASDPGSNGSQFFITFTAYPSLDGQYTIFGKAIEGLDVLPKIVRGMPPASPTRMQQVYIVERPHMP